MCAHVPLCTCVCVCSRLRVWVSHVNNMCVHVCAHVCSYQTRVANTCFFSDEHSRVCSGCIYVYVCVHVCATVCKCVFHVWTHVCSRVRTCVFQLDPCLHSRRTHGCYRMSALVCVRVHIYVSVHVCAHVCSRVHLCVPHVRACVFHLDTFVGVSGGQMCVPSEHDTMC